MKYNIKNDYCTMSPDGLFGVRFNYSCFLHDRQYRNEVVNRKTRKQADVDLKNHIYSFYKIRNKKIIGWIVSRCYYIGVRIFGTDFVSIKIIGRPIWVK